MTVKTYAGLIRDIARDAEAISTRGQGLVAKLLAAGMVYAKQNNRTLGTGLDNAIGALEGLAPVTEGFFKKAASYARAVVEHGTINGVAFKAQSLASIEEADMIGEALALCRAVNVTAALEARVKANGGAKGGKPSTKPGPVTAPPVEPPAPAPVVDPVLDAETRCAALIDALIAAGATDALGRLTSRLLAAAQEQASKAA